MPLSQYISRHLKDMLAIIWWPTVEQDVSQRPLQGTWSNFDSLKYTNFNTKAYKLCLLIGIWCAIDLLLHPGSSLASKI